MLEPHGPRPVPPFFMIDLLIVTAFVVYAIGSGLRARRKASRGLGEYFLAGRSIAGWRAGMSMAATQFAADTPLLVTGLVATGGIFLIWRLWIYGLAFLLMAFVFSVGWRRGGILTDAELTEVRYSGRAVLPLRVLKAFYYGTIINCVVMAMVLVAAVRIAEVFLPWNEWLPQGVYAPAVSFVSGIGLELGASVTGLPVEVATANNLISILLILLFTALYSTTGGLRSVVATDVMQFSLAMLGTLVYAFVVVRHAGGLGGLVDRVVEVYGQADARQMLSFGPPGGEVLMPFLVIVGLQWFFQMNSDGTGYLAQRSMACRTDRDARVAGVVFAWAQILFRSLIWLVIAVGLLVLYPFTRADAGAEGFAAAREILFVTGVQDLLPAGVRGLMLTGLLAALASTIDTHLNWGASYWSNDIYSRLVCRRWLGREPGDRELVVAARLSNVLILVIALAIMANLGSIQTAWFISLLFGAGMGSVLVLRWLWERINLYSELAGMAAASTVAAVGITFVTPPTAPEVLVRFFRRVRPVGFWGKTARLAGQDPGVPRSDLARRLRLAGLCSLSLFLLLIGLGRLLVPAPDGSAFWTWGSLLVGLAVVPFWWKQAFLVENVGVRRMPAPSAESRGTGDDGDPHETG
jgi:SSS family solute:Na+ symporter